MMRPLPRQVFLCLVGRYRQTSTLISMSVARILMISPGQARVNHCTWIIALFGARHAIKVRTEATARAFPLGDDSVIAGAGV